MKKKNILILTFLGFQLFSFGQKNNNSCGFQNFVNKKIEENSDYLNKMNQLEIRTSNWVNDNQLKKKLLQLFQL